MKNDTVKGILFFAIGILFLLVLSPLAGAENLYGSVIRIHVLVNSDSQADQELKLLVRDRLLLSAKESFPANFTREEAAVFLEDHLAEWEETAQQVLRENGCSDPVFVSLTEEYYPTRAYTALSLPAGKYLSLQVKIGEAQGKNWWCVLFPPICLNTALNTETALLDAGMEEENVKTVTMQGGEYEVRFKILEWWEDIKKEFRLLTSEKS